MRHRLAVLTLATAAALPAQWDPIAPGGFRIQGMDFGLILGSHWYGHAEPGGGITLLHAGPHAVAFTDTAPFRLEMHVSYVWAAGPPCAHGGRFIATDGWCGHPTQWFVSDRDPMLGSPIDMWIGQNWQENLSMCVHGAYACPYALQGFVGFALFVDQFRVVPL